ncbi:hypothetical protein SZ55_4463 [Pseudomonas sp. FeS53a]|nr:hypothetical protein SZ55_4463 [Pseudomonas sp. FeS53a]
MVIHTRSPSCRSGRRNAGTALRRGRTAALPARVMPGARDSMRRMRAWGRHPVLRIRRSDLLITQER